MPLINLYLLPFLFYWTILFAVCFVAVEYGQSYFYDEATPSAAIKVAIGSTLLAMLLTYTRPHYDTMFTSEILWTVILAIAAFVIFTFIFRFHPWHGAALGIGSVLLFAGMATMALDSFQNRNRPESERTKYSSKPIRRATGVPVTPPATK